MKPYELHSHWIAAEPFRTPVSDHRAQTPAQWLRGSVAGAEVCPTATATSGAQRVIRSPVADGDRPGVSRFRENGSCPGKYARPLMMTRRLLGDRVFDRVVMQVVR